MPEETRPYENRASWGSLATLRWTIIEVESESAPVSDEQLKVRVDRSKLPPTKDQS